MPDDEELDDNQSRFLDMKEAGRQLLLATIRDDGKGVKIARPDGRLETYIVKRVKWGDD